MKLFLCFLVLIGVIVPFYNFQNDNIFSLTKAECITFVKEEDGKQFFEEGCLDKNNVVELNSSVGIIFKTKLTTDELKRNLNIRIIKKETIEDLEISYGCTPYYSKKILLDGKAANVQIVEKEGYVIVGMPIIYSGF